MSRLSAAFCGEQYRPVTSSCRTENAYAGSGSDIPLISTNRNYGNYTLHVNFRRHTKLSAKAMRRERIVAHLWYFFFLPLFAQGPHDFVNSRSLASARHTWKRADLSNKGRGHYENSKMRQAGTHPIRRGRVPPHPAEGTASKSPQPLPARGRGRALMQEEHPA